MQDGSHKRITRRKSSPWASNLGYFLPSYPGPLSTVIHPFSSFPSPLFPPAHRGKGERRGGRGREKVPIKADMLIQAVPRSSRGREKERAIADKYCWNEWIFPPPFPLNEDHLEEGYCRTSVTIHHPPSLPLFLKRLGLWESELHVAFFFPTCSDPTCFHHKPRRYPHEGGGGEDEERSTEKEPVKGAAVSSSLPETPFPSSPLPIGVRLTW